MLSLGRSIGVMESRYMFRKFLRSKIHRATVTQADLDYEGSLTIPPDLMRAAAISPFESVHVWNVRRDHAISVSTVLRLTWCDLAIWSSLRPTRLWLLMWQRLKAWSPKLFSWMPKIGSSISDQRSPDQGVAIQRAQIPLGILVAENRSRAFDLIFVKLAVKGSSTEPE